MDALIPYDVQFYHGSDPNYLFIPGSQRQAGEDQNTYRHYLPRGTYMVGLTYDGPESCHLRFQAIGRPVTFPATAAAGTSGVPRTGPLVKISVTNQGEYLDMYTTPRTSTLTNPQGRATVSVYPSELYSP